MFVLSKKSVFAHREVFVSKTLESMHKKAKRNNLCDHLLVLTQHTETISTKSVVTN